MIGKTKQDFHIDPRELKYWLEKVDTFFNIDSIAHLTIDHDYVKEYYKKSNFGYWIVHSKKGAVHMALNSNRRFNKEGYYGQARYVEDKIRTSNTSSVLELASGKGFNSTYLAEKNPQITFKALDLFDMYVQRANRHTRHLQNLEFKKGNFQKIPFEDESFDTIFEVEGVCHATDMRTVLREVKRVLRPGGSFILFDGFQTSEYATASEDFKNAVKLVETAMAIKKGWIIDDWLNIAQQEGFELSSVDNISNEIMPNLMRFQAMAKKYFQYNKFQRFLLRIFSRTLLMNAIAGLLMPYTIGQGIHGYYRIHIIVKDTKNG